MKESDFMSRTTGRTMALLGLLQARSEWAGEDLRARLEVSERTLRRDIDDLRSLGYGIEATRGRHGGYRLGPGAAVPPLTLSREEAVAIAVGLRAAALGAVTGMEEVAASALAKLEQSLGSAMRQQISDLVRAMLPLGARIGDIDMETLTAIARAIRTSARVRIRYTRHDGVEITRVIEPHRIMHTPRAWYLVAWDTDRRDWRTLRMDRLAAPAVLRETFTTRQIPDEALRTFTSQAISTQPYRHQVQLRVHASAHEVSGEFGPTVAEVTDNGDGTSTLTTGSNSPEEIALYLGVSGFSFEILEGDALRNVLGEIALRFSAAAGSQ